MQNLKSRLAEKSLYTSNKSLEVAVWHIRSVMILLRTKQGILFRDITFHE